MPAKPRADCPFCRPDTQAQAVETCGSCLAIPDRAPVSEGHLLIIPARHAADLFDMTDEELTDAVTLLRRLRDRAAAADPHITGFNVGCNCGRSAGQRIPHAHIHFIPRREGDGPRADGVKGVIRNKMNY